MTSQDELNQKAMELAKELSEIEPDKERIIGMVGSQLWKGSVGRKQIDKALAHLKSTWKPA